MDRVLKMNWQRASLAELNNAALWLEAEIERRVPERAALQVKECKHGEPIITGMPCPACVEEGAQ